MGVFDQSNDIVSNRLHTSHADAATVLGGEGIIINPLDITIAGKGDDNVLLRNEVFVFDIGGIIGDFSTPFIGKARFDFLKFLNHDIDFVFTAGEDSIVFSDIGFKLSFFSIEFILLHTL